MTVRAGAVSGPSVERRERAQGVWRWLLLFGVGFLVFVPVGFLVLGSFSTRTSPTDIFSNLSLENYRKVWSDPATYLLFYNTLIYVLGAVAFSIIPAVLLAWLVERTDMPGKIWIYACVPMTLALPAMLQAMAWVLLASPRVGFLNQFLKDLFGLQDAPLNIYSLAGMIFVEGLHLVPTAFLMLVPLLRSMDPALEEAAAMSGAPPLSYTRKITLRLMIPGLLAVLIYQAMTALEVFEIPGILGMPAGIFIFSSKIYAALHPGSYLPDYGEANSLAMLYLLVAVITTWAYSRSISNSQRYSIVSGKAYRPTLLRLGRWKWLGGILVGAFLLFSLILPFLVFLYVSLLPWVQAPSRAAFHSMTWQYYLDVFGRDVIGLVVWNTLIMTVSAATATVAISFLISLVVVRSQFPGRRILDQLAFAPHAIPGIVMAVAFLWLYLQVDRTGFPIFGTIWSIVVVFAVRYMSYGTRALNAAFLQIHRDLEEASYVSGAVQWRTMLRVFFPLVTPALAGVWLWSFLHAIQNASIPLMLYEGQDNQVLSVLIWNMWDAGQVQDVGVIGVLLVIVLMMMALCVRAFGFGKGVHIQAAG